MQEGYRAACVYERKTTRDIPRNHYIGLQDHGAFSKQARGQRPRSFRSYFGHRRCCGGERPTRCLWEGPAEQRRE